MQHSQAHHARLKQETFITLLQDSAPAKALRRIHIFELTFQQNNYLSGLLTIRSQSTGPKVACSSHKDSSP